MIDGEKEELKVDTITYYKCIEAESITLVYYDGCLGDDYYEIPEHFLKVIE